MAEVHHRPGELPLSHVERMKGKEGLFQVKDLSEMIGLA